MFRKKHVGTCVHNASYILSLIIVFDRKKNLCFSFAPERERFRGTEGERETGPERDSERERTRARTRVRVRARARQRDTERDSEREMTERERTERESGPDRERERVRVKQTVGVVCTQMKSEGRKWQYMSEGIPPSPLCFPS